jgi:chromate transporter
MNLLYLFLEFFKIGLFTFGGGYAMIPLIRETVLKYNWISETEFYDLIGVCESTPGPIAVNMATFIGASQGGFGGSLLATLGVVLPSFIIIIIVALILDKFIQNKYVKQFMKGVKPVVAGLIISSGLLLIAKNLGYVNMTTFNFSSRGAILLACVIAIYFLYKLIFKKKMNTILLIIISAGLGLLVCFYIP